MGMGRMFRTSWPVLRDHARRWNSAEMWSVLKKNRKFPVYSLPSSLLDALSISIALPLLVQLYGPVTGGYYSLVWRAITVPSVVLTLAIGDTFHSRLAVCARETPEEIGGLFRRTSLTLLIIGSIPSLILIVWGPPLFGFVFGSRWAVSGVMAATIAPWYLSQFVVNPVSRVVFVLSGQESKLIWDVVCLVSILAVFMLARQYHLSDMHTIRSLSLVNTLLYVGYFGILLRIIAQYKRGLAAKVLAA